MKVEKAWEHVKALMPEAEFMFLGTMHSVEKLTFVRVGKNTFCIGSEIEWPEEISQWPLNFKPATSNDISKIVRIRQHTSENWRPEYRTLLAVLPDNYNYRFIVSNGPKDWIAFNYAEYPEQPCTHKVNGE